MTEPWVSVEDVAKHLGVVKDSVYGWIEHRGLPAHKIGRLWKFKLSEVDEWVGAAEPMTRPPTDTAHDAEGDDDDQGPKPASRGSVDWRYRTASRARYESSERAQQLEGRSPL